MNHAAILFFALLLDGIFGEPEWLWSRLPHPAVLMGRAIGFLDHRLNRPPQKRNGLVALWLLVGAAGLIGLFLGQVPGHALIEVVLVAILLAQRSLARHVQAVANALQRSPEEGRRAVSHIVGRDTAGMDSAAITRAAIESAGENFSDGVIAPAFWFLLFGLPGMLIYKIVNTADSMIGYRNARYASFGRAAARLDDLLNWIPARLSALLIAFVQGRLSRWQEIRRDAALHRSPNAGWPEAAMAIGLNIALAGPRSYDGRLQDFSWVNPEGNRRGSAYDIRRAVAVLWRAWGLFVALTAMLALA